MSSSHNEIVATKIPEGQQHGHDGRAIREGFPLLPVQSGRVHGPLPQEEQRRIDLFSGQAEIGDSVISKTDTAMVNEVLCEFLCHNLTCLIQEQETLGITPVFWKDEQLADGERPAILPIAAQ